MRKIHHENKILLFKSLNPNIIIKGIQRFNFGERESFFLKKIALLAKFDAKKSNLKKEKKIEKFKDPNYAIRRKIGRNINRKLYEIKKKRISLKKNIIL